MMPRKHYIALAAAIRQTRDAVYGNREASAELSVVMMALHIAQVLAADNERFDRSKFYEACGVHPK